MSSLLFTLLCSLFLCFLLKSLFSGKAKKLPPGPLTFPVIGNLRWLRRNSGLEQILRRHRSKYGPIFTIRVGSLPAIFIADRDLAHKALVQNGAVFSNRPKSSPATKVMNSNQRSINSAAYGPVWRLLRRNLTAEILHPSRVRSYSRARRWVLGVLVNQLAGDGSESGVEVIGHFQYAMFCLLVFMCFGDKLEEKQIREIEEIQRRVILRFHRYNVLNFLPASVGKILFRNRWNELMQLAADRENTLIPFIKARIEAKEQRLQGKDGDEEDEVLAYVDTLMNLELPDENRKLGYGEMTTLCGEFINAGTDTTSTALQWIMANLVKHPSVQAKLYDEISGVIGTTEDKGVREDDLHKMPYLKAVVLEGLRRHPPAHFVLPHSVTEEVEFEGYVVPKNAMVNFMVAEMGLDPEVWEDPMEFKPERFLSKINGGEEFDISGSREIKMMPFGAGRRICPGLGLALLHLEYFVANLVWLFEWRAVEGDDVDLAEKQEFTTVMKHPLRVNLVPRNKLI